MKTRFIAKTFTWFALIAVIFCSCGSTHVYDISVTANGSPTQTTTQISIIFNYYDVIEELTASDVKLSGIPGIKKGTMSEKKYNFGNYRYDLPISGFTRGGKLTVSIEKSGCGGENTVQIYYYVPPEVTFESVQADGSNSSTTTQLKLTFSKEITGLAASDITLSGVTGVTKGTFTGSGQTYTLDISGFTKGGTLSVAVAKSGCIIKNSPQTVTIYYYIPEVTFERVQATGSNSSTTTQLKLTFSQEIPGLTASDITLSGVTGVTKGTFTVSGQTYTLDISGFTKGGTLSVSVTKSGYSIKGSPQTVTIYYAP